MWRAKPFENSSMIGRHVRHVPLMVYNRLQVSENVCCPLECCVPIILRVWPVWQDSMPSKILILTLPIVGSLFSEASGVPILSHNFGAWIKSWLLLSILLG